MNNKGADQPAHLRSLINTFVIRLLESIISKLATRVISLFLLVSVAEHDMVGNPEDGFCRVTTYFMCRPCVRAFYTPPQTLFVGGILFSRCPSVRPSVTLCFLNNLEESLPDFHQTLQTCSYMQDKYFRQKVRARIRPSVTLCFLNNLEESLPDFHQTLQTCSYMQDKYFRQKVRARGQFY